MQFLPFERPETSIWGTIQGADQILPGVWQVDTASHGGIILSEQRQAAMPDALRLDGCQYEEDVNWSLVWLAFADELRRAYPKRSAELQIAHDIARNWLPERYGQFTGKTVTPNESYIKRKICAYSDAIGKIAVVAAWGDWAEWVPKGKVGILGRRVVSVNYIGHVTYETDEYRALVDAHRYSSGNIINTFDAIGAEQLLTAA